MPIKEETLDRRHFLCYNGKRWACPIFLNNARFGSFMNKRIKKIKRLFKKLVLKRAKFFLRRVERFFFKELREEDFDRTVFGIVEKLRIKKLFKEDLRPIIMSVFIMVFLAWAIYIIASVAHSEEEDIFNEQTKEDINLSISEESEINKIHAETLNEYKLKSPEKKCEEDNNNKLSSNSCGKDDEKEIERQKSERVKVVAKRKPVIKAPMPYVYKVDSLGRRVCNKKNDHPGKSKQNKKKHMDMECCLDPDEIPNPNCYYSPEKYGKYLK